MDTWLLPEHFADVLPRQARTLESMRRTCLDLFAVHGFETVDPPLVEYIESLLTGTGTDLDNNAFKFTDQRSGKMVGLRVDFTPQTARIDAHILNRSGVTRLCYAGACLHARPTHPLSSREPIVAGAELFGASGFEADAQVLTLAVKTLRALGVTPVHLDLGHMGVFRAVIAGEQPTSAQVKALARALRTKNPVALKEACAGFGKRTQEALELLLDTFGSIDVVGSLKQSLSDYPEAVAALEEIERLAAVSTADTVSVDFCDVQGYRYLTGATFCVHIPERSQAVLRGGRYDGIGTAFGRSRPACGFTVYLRALSEVDAFQHDVERRVVLAKTPLSAAMSREVERLRKEGTVVLTPLPGESFEDEGELRPTDELVEQGGKMTLLALR